MSYRKPRWAVEHQVGITTRFTRFTAELANISETGAKMTGDVTFDEGETFLLSVGGQSRHVTVRWSTNGVTGVHFDTPLDPAELEYVRQSPRQKQVWPSRVRVHGTYREM